MDLAPFAAEDWNGIHADPRVTHLVAIEPGLIWGVGPADIADLVPDVPLIGLDAGSDRMLATDFDASGLAGLLPGATVERIAPAIHCTALPLCKPMAEAILIEEQDDPVCTDPAGTDRAGLIAGRTVQMHDPLSRAADILMLAG